MSRSLAALALGLTALALLSGCAQASDSTISTSSVTIDGPAYPEFPTYSSVKVVRNVPYRKVAGVSLGLNVCSPRSGVRRPAVIIVHGGSWAKGDKSSPAYNSVCEWIAHSGFVAFDVDYRLAPAHPFPDGLEDVEAAVSWIRSNASRYDVDPDRIGAFGGSAGGNIVALLGTTRSQLSAVVELSGPADLTAAGHELSDLLPYERSYLHCSSLASCPAARRASPVYHVDAGDPPFFVASSLAERIPLSQSNALVAALRGKGVPTTFVTVRGSNHSVAMLTTGLRARIIAFYRKYLL